MTGTSPSHPRQYLAATETPTPEPTFGTLHRLSPSYVTPVDKTRLHSSRFTGRGEDTSLSDSPPLWGFIPIEFPCQELGDHKRRPTPRSSNMTISLLITQAEGKIYPRSQEIRVLASGKSYSETIEMCSVNKPNCQRESSCRQALL